MNEGLGHGRAPAMLAAALMLALLALAHPPPARAGNVTTAAYNDLRDNWDPEEPALSPADVQSQGFQRIFSRKLSGEIYAQPLVYEGTVVVTTEKAKAYGVSATSGKIEWKRSFGTPFKATTIGCSDLTPDIGSTSTPVIDPTTGTVYLTTRLESHGRGGLLARAHWYLQALSATTGQERPGFPVEISGTPFNTPEVPFNESFEAQRPGLLLLEGVVYIAFASDCDITPYRGIVVGVNAASGAITTMWSDESGAGTDENSQGGIWQSGGGLVSNEPGRIILTTGNGVSPSPAPSDEPPATLSESVVGLRVGEGGRLEPTQFFAPSNAPTLDQNDEDLGSGGPIALPGEYFGTPAIPHLVVQVGKDGRIFLINADDMGGYRQGAEEGDAVLQTLGPFDGVWGHPAAYGGQGGWVYVLESAGGGYLRALSYGLGGHGEPQLANVATSSESFGYTSGSPLVTSDGTQAGSAVVWVLYTREGATEDGAGGQLRAYDAEPEGSTLALLWSAPIGDATKFAVPTAWDGRIYVGNRQGELQAFGDAANAPLQSPPLQFGSVEVGRSSSRTLSVSALQSLKLTAPASASGEEPAPQAHAASAQAGAGAGTGAGAGAGPGGHAVHTLTAGPHKIPPSGEERIARGVFRIAQPPVGSAVAAGGRLRLRVSFRPAHAGPVVGVITLHTSSGTRTIAVSGYGSRPGLLLSAPPLAFGVLATGAGGKYLSVTFSNSSTRPERITGLRMPAGPYKVSGVPALGTVLAPRQSVTLSLHFAPSSPGRYDSRIAIATDGGSAGEAVSGSAIAGAPLLVVRPATLDFGAVALGSSRTLRFRVEDAGNVPLTISRAIAPIGAFSARAELPEGISIEAHGYLEQAVTFAPTAGGATAGTYLLNGDDGRGYERVRLLGRGLAPRVRGGHELA